MARKFSADRLVIASHNSGKIREMVDLMAPYDIAVCAAGELSLAEPEETGTTFLANAELKSRAAATVSELPSFADDSGLVVPALGGQPGIYSARWGGPARDFYVAMARVEAELTKSDHAAEGADAYFVSALSLCWPDGHCENFESQVHGNLSFPPRGENGFGYDPIFIPAGYDITFGEMPPEEKHALSHRARAFEKLVAACFPRDG
jgi:XTP/dITP diphosphohydrolase